MDVEVYQDVPSRPPENIAQLVANLVKYPPSIISTTVEKASEASSSLWASENPQLNLTNASKSPNTGARGRRKHKEKSSKKAKEPASPRENPDANSSTITFGSEPDHFSSVSEHMSDIVSVSDLSNGHDTPVNIGNNGNHYNQAGNLSRTDSNTTIDIADPRQLLELKREAANARGQLKSLQFVVDDINRERAQLQSKVSELEKQLRQRTKESGDAIETKRRLIGETEDLKASIVKWESIAAEYQDVIDRKAQEVTLAKEEQRLTEKELESLRVQVEQLKLDIERRNIDNADLRGKLTRQGVEIEGLLKKQEHIEDNIKSYKAQLKEAHDSKQQQEAELSKLQSKLKDSQEKVIKEQSEALAIRSSLDKVQTECVQLKESLMKLNYQNEKEKEYMLKHLEDIETDIKQARPGPRGSLADSSLPADISLARKEAEIARLNRDVADLRQSVQQRTTERDEAVRDLLSVKRELGDKAQLEHQLRMTINDLNSKLIGFDVTVKSQTEYNELVAKERATNEARIAVLTQDNKNLQLEIKNQKESVERFERTIKQLRSDLVAKESRIEIATKEITRLEGQLSATSTNAQVPLNSELNTLKLERDRLRSEKADLERIVSSLNVELRTVCSNFDNERLKLREQFDKDIGQRESELLIQQEQLKKKLLDSENSITELQRELGRLSVSTSTNSTPTHQPKPAAPIEADGLNGSEKVRMLESNLRLIMRKYKEAVVARKDLEQKLNLKAREEPLNTDQITEQYLESSSEPDVKPVSIDADCQTNITDPQVQLLTDECYRLAAIIASKEQLIQDMEGLVLRLETEKGELEKNRNSSGSPTDPNRAHLSSLESIVQSREAELESANIRIRELEESIQDERLRLEKRIESLEEDLRKEKAIVKDLRHTIFLEKRDSMNAKKELSTTRKQIQEANFLADKRRQDVINAELVLEQKVVEEGAARLRANNLQIELTKAQEELAKLRGFTTYDFAERDQPIHEQLSSLQLTIRERDQELATANYKLAEAVRAHEFESNQLRFQLANLQSELDQLRVELEKLRSERTELVKTQAELREALQESFDANAKLRTELDNNGNQNQHIQYGPELTGVQIGSEAIDNQRASNLLVCLDSLQEEMDSLQKQIISEQDMSEGGSGHGLQI